MDYSKPCIRNLRDRGFIEGLTIYDKSSGKPQSHYFGGVPYGLPPVGPFRWRKPRPLPPCYRYGTRANSGKFTGQSSVCPQPSWRGENQAALWDENCLQCNIWIPTGKPPAEGWPVYFFIHGGFLQWGSANGQHCAALLSETSCKCIIVMPAYRLNIFGFLAGFDLKEESGMEHEAVGNWGFWDQRLALEWTHHNINYFGGDASNLTVGGYSAGANSVFFQLAYDLYLPGDKAVISRAVMHSNGPGVQPKDLDEHNTQYLEVLDALGISQTLSSKQRLARLRELSPVHFIESLKKLRDHAFRPITDGVFIRHDLFKEIESGDFGQRMKMRGVPLFTGECRDENHLYGAWRTPENSREAVFERFLTEYPRPVCERLMHYYSPRGQLPVFAKDWRSAFGHIFANVQVHGLERGFVSRLALGGMQPNEDIFRYRIEWRAAGVSLPKEWGVTHSTDMAIWFFGNGTTLTEEEKRIVNRFIEPFSLFVRGKLPVHWVATRDQRSVRRLRSDGSIDVWEDIFWQDGVELWDKLQTSGSQSTRLSKL